MPQVLVKPKFIKSQKIYSYLNIDIVQHFLHLNGSQYNALFSIVSRFNKFDSFLRNHILFLFRGNKRAFGFTQTRHIL